MPDYILRLDYRFPALDDPEAREVARRIAAAIDRPVDLPSGRVMAAAKLQRVEPGERPRGVRMENLQRSP